MSAAPSRPGPAAHPGTAAPQVRHDTARLPASACYSCAGCSEAEPVNPTERRWARTVDEAFRTPAWRCAVSGPWDRPSPIRVALELFAAALVGLALVGVML